MINQQIHDLLLSRNHINIKLAYSLGVESGLMSFYEFLISAWDLKCYMEGYVILIVWDGGFGITDNFGVDMLAFGRRARISGEIPSREKLESYVNMLFRHNIHEDVVDSIVEFIRLLYMLEIIKNNIDEIHDFFYKKIINR